MASDAHCDSGHALASIDGEVMLLARHGGGFSVDASVCITGDVRAGLERLLRYCARPPFAMERLHRKGQDHLLYHCPKPQSDGATIRKILDHIGEESTPPKLSKARGLPLWAACDEAEPKEYFDDGADYDIGQHWPDGEIDQRVNW